MSARQTAAVDRALELVSLGMSRYRAAKTCGIALSTIYKAYKRSKSKVDTVEAQAPVEPHSVLI